MLNVVGKTLAKVITDLGQKHFTSVHDSTSDHNLFQTQGQSEVGAHCSKIVANHIPNFMIIRDLWHFVYVI